MAAGIQIEADEARRKLEGLDINSAQMHRDLQKIIRTVLMKARSQVSRTAKGVLDNDPRQAYKAVRSSVYRRILGGQINIISSRRASKYRAQTVHNRLVDIPQSNGKGHYGGNRRERTKRSNALDSYWGKDRGFILRFLNDGTDERSMSRPKHSYHNPDIKTPGRNKGHSSYAHRNTGGRGHISARNWFGPASQAEMVKASEQLSNLIDRAIQEVWAKS